MPRVRCSLPLWTAALLTLALQVAQAANAPADKGAEPAVKKSDNGICHDKSSPSYGNTKKFTAFNIVIKNDIDFVQIFVDVTNSTFFLKKKTSSCQTE